MLRGSAEPLFLDLLQGVPGEIGLAGAAGPSNEDVLEPTTLDNRGERIPEAVLLRIAMDNFQGDPISLEDSGVCYDKCSRRTEGVNTEGSGFRVSAMAVAGRVGPKE